MHEVPVAQIEEQVKSAFPEGAIRRVQVLAYGDDPGVEPGETAVRVFISDKEVVKAFEDASRGVRERLYGELPTMGWVEFRTDAQEELAHSDGPIRAVQSYRFKGPKRTLPPADAAEQLTPVMTRLGTADLATVDTLITAGIASSRAEVLRWAVGRIRANPAYAKIQDRVQEISELRSSF
jgi:hypothetical protein